MKQIAVLAEILKINRNKGRRTIISGNQAAALGALAAGCRFFAGYPITPSSDILATMAKCLPSSGGIFYQAEDELAAIGMAIAASACGLKSLTATSGPGFSLMQEELGWAIINEIPLVIIDAMRIGPSTGQPTKPAAADINCLVHGRHGDGGDCVMVIAPASVQECFKLTVLAFNWAEKFQLPVLVAIDGYLANLCEALEIPANGAAVIEKKPIVKIGDGAGAAYGGVIHDQFGRRRSFSPDICRRALQYLSFKKTTLPLLADTEGLTDCDYLLISYGFASRAAKSAVLSLRRDGIKAGLLDLKTIWPLHRQTFNGLFPAGAKERIKKVIAVENNTGQLSEFLRDYLSPCSITTFAKWQGKPIQTAELVKFCRQATTGSSQPAPPLISSFNKAKKDENQKSTAIQVAADYPFCPGCGHKIFRSVLLDVLKERNLTKTDVVFTTGIGCGGIVATTLDADVIKTSHGRTLNAARAVKLIYPDKTVIAVSGDGDLVNIGGNALIHTAREKNRFPLLCVCLDNANYGMTGGQLSATTPLDSQTAIPFRQHPFNLRRLLYEGCGVDFFAVTAVPCRQHLKAALNRALDFIQTRKSFAFIQVLSPCATHFSKRNPEFFTKAKLQPFCAVWERANETQCGN